MLADEVGRKVFTLSSYVFIVMLGFGIVGPILPTYAGSFGASYSIVGLVISAFGLARILSDVPSGSMSDRFGRRPTMIIGMLLFSLSGLLAAYAMNIEHLILARLIQGLGAAIFTTSAMAYIADLIPIDKRGRYMGYYQSSFFLGSAVGPAVGGFLTFAGGIRTPFLVLSALALFAAGSAYKGLRELPSSLSKQKDRKVSVSSAVSHAFSTRSAVIANFSAVVTFLMMSSVRFTAIPIFSRASLGLGEFEIGVTLSVIALANFVMVRWSGSLVDRIGGVASLIYGFLSSGIIAALFALTRDFTSIVMVGLIFGVSSSLVMPAQAVLAVDVSDPNHRGLSLGVYRLFSDIGLITGPILTGIISDRFAVNTPFYATAAICVATAIIIAARGTPSR